MSYREEGQVMCVAAATSSLFDARPSKITEGRSNDEKQKTQRYPSGQLGFLVMTLCTATCCQHSLLLNNKSVKLAVGADTYVAGNPLALCTSQEHACSQLTPNIYVRTCYPREFVSYYSGVSKLVIRLWFSAILGNN